MDEVKTTQVKTVVQTQIAFYEKKLLRSDIELVVKKIFTKLCVRSVAYFMDINLNYGEREQTKLRGIPDAVLHDEGSLNKVANDRILLMIKERSFWRATRRENTKLGH